MLSAAVLDRSLEGAVHQRARLVFALVGPARSGLSALQSSLQAHPQLACLGDVLSCSEAARRQAHEAVFGPTQGEPEYCTADTTLCVSPERYLDVFLFRPATERFGFGCKLTYEQLTQLELWDYLREQGRQPGFCLIHVVRNPLATFLSWQRAKEHGTWYCPADQKPPAYPPILSRAWTPAEVVHHVQQQEANQVRAEQVCRDQLLVPYYRLCHNPKGVWRSVCQFLGVAASPWRPAVRRMSGIRPLERIVLRSIADQDCTVRRCLEDPTLC